MNESIRFMQPDDIIMDIIGHVNKPLYTCTSYIDMKLYACNCFDFLHTIDLHTVILVRNCMECVAYWVAGM